MKINTSNKDTPQIQISTYPDIGGQVIIYRHLFYAAKKRGKYKLKDRGFVVRKRLKSSRKIQEKFLTDTKEYIKRGRYHDYFFIDKPISSYEVT